MSHEEADLLLVGPVEVGPMGTRQVLGEMDQMVLVLLDRPRFDPCVVAFDRLGDQLIVAQSHT
jgi:hypothetical protein